MPHDELFRALRAVARGERYLAPVVTERLMARWQQPARAELTDRELEVLRRVARGDGSGARSPEAYRIRLLGGIRRGPRRARRHRKVVQRLPLTAPVNERRHIRPTVGEKWFRGVIRRLRYDL